MLRGDLAVLQAPMLDGLALDTSAFREDAGSPAEVDVGRRQIIQALVVAVMVVMVDERLDLRFQITGQIVVFQQDAVLERLVPTLDLALGLWMIGRTANVGHLPVVEPAGEIAGDVA